MSEISRDDQKVLDSCPEFWIYELTRVALPAFCDSACLSCFWDRKPEFFDHGINEVGMT